MNKIYGFWIASSVVLFLLSLVYLQHNLHRKNMIFAWWLCLGVSMQLVSAYGLVLGYPRWMTVVWTVADVLSFAMALGVLGVAFRYRSCPVNRALLYGIGAMLILNLISRWWGDHLGQNVRIWLLNIAFLGPAAFLLLMFSNIRVDRLPLYVKSVFPSATSSPYLCSHNATRCELIAYSKSIRRARRTPEESKSPSTLISEPSFRSLEDPSDPSRRWIAVLAS